MNIEQQALAAVPVFFIIAIAALFLALIVVPALNASRNREEFFKGDENAQFVAEAWLDWEICRGSTMYRAAFRSADRARAAAADRAELLDLYLPKKYVAEYSNGRPYWEDYNFSIRWGVRPLTEGEQANGVLFIWTDRMPGHSGHKGEHREAHPLLQGDLTGYKV